MEKKPSNFQSSAPLPELFKTVLEACADHIYIYDHKGCYLYANPSGLEALGLPLESVLGRPWQEIGMSIAIMERFEHDLQAVIASGKPLTRQITYSGKQGKRYYEYLLSPVKNAAHEVQMVVANGRDLTQRIAAEKQASENEERFRNLCEAAPDGIVLVNQLGAITLVNTQIEKLFGYSRKALLGQPIEKLIPERYRMLHKRHQAAYRQSSTTREMGMGMELYGLRSDGTEFPVDVKLSPFISKRGPKTIAIIRDITVRQNAEKQLREKEALLRSIIDNTPAIVFLKDLQGRYLMMNQRCSQLFHMSQDETRGKTDYELFPKEVADRLRRNDRIVAETGRAMEVDEQLPQHDGLHTYLSVKFPLADGEGVIYGICGIATDITYRKQAEEQIRALNHSLQHKLQELARVNQELEAFSYSVSHDLRAPLRAMAGFSKVLEENYGKVLDQEGKHYVHRIQTASQRMSFLLDGLLQLSRINRHELDRSTLNLSAMAAEILEDFQQEQQERHVDIYIQPDITAAADGRLLRICLENLLSNAWKYTCRQKRPQVKFTCVEKEGEKIFIISDNGAGFNPKYQFKMFQVFQRLHSDREFEGLGIGLATVQRVVHRHGGTIWAEGEEGQGASFYFTLNPSG